MSCASGRVVEQELFHVRLKYPELDMQGFTDDTGEVLRVGEVPDGTVHLRVGEKLRVRFIGTNSGFIHPMHLHGGPFQAVAIDGYPVPEGTGVYRDTVNVGPGQRYDVIWEAREPGKWLLHCHINHHATNNNVEEEGGGGLTMIIEVTSCRPPRGPYFPQPSPSPTPCPDTWRTARTAPGDRSSLGSRARIAPDRPSFGASRCRSLAHGHNHGRRGGGAAGYA